MNRLQFIFLIFIIFITVNISAQTHDTLQISIWFKGKKVVDNGKISSKKVKFIIDDSFYSKGQVLKVSKLDSTILLFTFKNHKSDITIYKTLYSKNEVYIQKMKTLNKGGLKSFPSFLKYYLICRPFQILHLYDSWTISKSVRSLKCLESG